MELFQVVTVAEAKALLEAHWPPESGETVALEHARGRVLARAVTSPLDVPPFTRSTVDGYAVSAASTFGASPSLPAYLELSGQVQMGQKAESSFVPGQAVPLPTGGMLPPGADAAVMIENTEGIDVRTVAVVKPVAPGENLLARGEDVGAGQDLFAAGHRLRPQDLALLAACGVKEVTVRARLRVGIVSTGNELRRLDSNLEPGQIYDSNTYAVQALVAADGGEPQCYGPVADDSMLLRATLEQALAVNDVVLLSGGSSVGVLDLTREVLEQLHGEILFHGVAIGPGKPTLAAGLGKQLLVGLPGHPASAIVAYLVMLSPLVVHGTHAADRYRVITARLTRSVASRSGREDYVMVRLFTEGEITYAEPVLGKSGLLFPLTRAGGLALIPLVEEGKAAGETVEVMLI